MNSSTIPGSLVQPRQTPPPQYSQPQTPKMMHLRFGANSPGPSPYYSPSSTPMQPIRYPGPVTQLHPQHKRLLGQKRTAERKAESWDPYCHLMTEKEKEWITRLQMIQLQTENPDLEDYYYQEYYRRMEDKLVEEELGMRSKREPPKLFTPYITKTEPYTPVVHIEGSLGQVAVSTCYSPRRAIGAVNANPTHGSHELFVVLLEVEEEDRMKGKVLAEAEEKKAKEKTRRKVQNILSHWPFTWCLEPMFLSCLMFSKGKKLISRLLPFLDQAAGLRILTVVTSHIPTLMSRDMDEVLPVLYPSLRTVISMLTFSQLIVILKNLTSVGETPEGPGGLLQTCQNKFGLSLLYALLSQGERLLSSGSPLDPSIGDFETWTDTIFQVAGELSHCTLVEPLLLPSNLLTLFCRYLDKRTVHQLKSNME
uniref:PAT1 homolog 2 n=1 Tax=Gadus morhua TaxID=8049 RepID=A0A8C4Z3N2_GADMO